MKVITIEDIKRLNINPSMCYEWVKEMIIHKKDAILPEKIHMIMPGNEFCNVMPCLISGNRESAVGGVKVVTRYPKRIPSLDSKILLFNADSGEFLALMDGNWITAMRTGAVAAHSVITFAKSDWNVIGMIGLGNVARATMLTLASITNKPLLVKLLRYKDQAELFIERFKEFDNIRFQISESAEECIKGSDVTISCATYFEKDIAPAEWFDDGALIVPVHTRGFLNCDLVFDKIYADDTGHVKEFKYFNRFRFFAEVSDVVNRKVVGRESDKERIIVYNIGISIHDINYAAHIYQLMQEKPEIFETLTDTNMQDPAAKFWV